MASQAPNREDPGGPDASVDSGAAGGSTDATRPGAAPQRLAGPGLLLALIAIGAWVTWRKTAHPYIDFGYELYLPWRLSEGDVLYRDHAYRNGPFSPLLNATLFRAFGASLSTLLWFNLALVGLFTAGVYRTFARLSGALVATVIGAVFVTLFAFAQYLPTENFNWVTPYQHGQVHGALLGLGVVVSWAGFLSARRPRWLLLGGVTLGLAFLTKAELFVPAAGVAAAGALLALLAPARDGHAPVPVPPTGALLLAATAGGAAVLLLCFGWLAVDLPPGAALDGLLGNWRYLGAAVAEDSFYLRGSGFDDPGGNLAATLEGAALLVAAGAGLLLLARALPARATHGAGAWLSGALLLAALLASVPTPAWATALRGLPVLAAGAVIGCGVYLVRNRSRIRALSPLALWSVWSALLLTKMLLNARIHHYGFVLAAPAVLLLAFLYLRYLPALGAARGRAELVRALAMALVLAPCVAHVQLSMRYYDQKTEPLGHGADMLYTRSAELDPIADGIRSALATLEERMAPDATLLVLAEGAGINYWLRRSSPTRYALFLPTEFDAVGGARVMLADVRADPPDWVLVVPRDFREFGSGPFGSSERSGQELLAWLAAEYAPAVVPHPIGILTMQRKSVSQSQ